MKCRQCITLAGAVLAGSTAGCLGNSNSTATDTASTNGDNRSTDEPTTTATKSATIAVETYVRAAANDPNPELIDRFFHSQSPTGDIKRKSLENTDSDNWADIAELDVNVVNENPTEEELRDRYAFISDAQILGKIVDIAVAAPESAVVEVDIETESQGLKSPPYRPVATEDGDWKIIW